MYKSPDMPDLQPDMPDVRPNSKPREMTDKPPEGVRKPIAVKTEEKIDLDDPTKDVRPPPPSMAPVVFIPSRMSDTFNMNRRVGSVQKRSLD